MVALLALAVAVPAAAQERPARLTVVVRHDDEPVRDATVRADTVVALTDAQGRAALSLAAGRHRLSVARPGFHPDTIGVTLRAGADTSVTIELEAQATTLETAIVTVSRSELQIDDEPLRVEVMAGDEIEEKTQMRPADLSYLLREMSGVRVQPTSPALGAAGLRIQGLRGQYALVLSDGLPLYGSVPGGLGLLQIPPLDLQQAEVIKGAASALYGTAAVAGVLNLVSKRPAHERTLLANVTSREGYDGALWLSRTLRRGWGYTLLAGAHRQRALDADDDGWADLPEFTRAELRPRLFWRDSAGSELLATVGAMAEDRAGGTVSGATLPGGETVDESLDTRRGDAGLVARWALPRGRHASARASFAWREERRRYDDERETNRFGAAFVELSLSGTGSSTGWLLGAALGHDRFTSREAPLADYRFTVPSAFAQASWSPAALLSIVASGRCDAHSGYGTLCAPRLSALLRPAEGLSVRLSGGGGASAPTPFSEETEGVPLSRLRLPLALRAERAWTGSLDVTALRGPLSVSATLFASRLTSAARRMELASDSPAVALAPSPLAMRTRGAELLALWKREPITIIADWSWLRATEWDAERGGQREVPRNPRQSGGLDVAWEEDESGTRVGLEIFYAGRQALDDDPYRTESRPYATVGLLATRRVGRAQLYLNAENLGDIRQGDHAPLLLPARARDGRWTVPQWAPLEGRTVNGGVRLTL